MSKHSKWSKVKHQKGAADAKKAGVFTKLARVITVAAREGGGDPAFNFALRTAVDRALAANMTKDAIERAIAKGSGAGDGAAAESVLYEGFAPGGVGILVEAITDSRNRTVANVKHAFTKHGGNLATSGAVQRMFDRRGVLHLSTEALTEEAQLALIDAGADDVISEEGETVVLAAVDKLKAVREAAEKAGLPIGEVGFEWLARETVAVDDPAVREQVEALCEALDADDDVSSVYSTM